MIRRRAVRVVLAFWKVSCAILAFAFALVSSFPRLEVVLVAESLLLAPWLMGVGLLLAKLVAH